LKVRANRFKPNSLAVDALRTTVTGNVGAPETSRTCPSPSSLARYDPSAKYSRPGVDGSFRIVLHTVISSSALGCCFAQRTDKSTSYSALRVAVVVFSLTPPLHRPMPSGTGHISLYRLGEACESLVAAVHPSRRIPAKVGRMERSAIRVGTNWATQRALQSRRLRSEQGRGKTRDSQFQASHAPVLHLGRRVMHRCNGARNPYARAGAAICLAGARPPCSAGAGAYDQ